MLDMETQCVQLAVEAKVLSSPCVFRHDKRGQVCIEGLEERLHAHSDGRLVAKAAQTLGWKEQIIN